MAASVLRRTAARARRGLDRPGWRWALALLTSMAGLVLDRAWYRIRWTGQEWSYRIDGQTLLSNQLLRPRRTIVDDLEIFLWAYTPRPGDVVVDVGAGTGTEALPLARAIGPTGRVVAVEAHPDTAAVLARAVAVNRLPNVVAVHAAVADEPGTLEISDSTDYGTNTVLAGGTVRVPAVTLDDLLDEHHVVRVALLKMNIEGAERLAIRGLAGSVDRIDRAVISCHDFLGTEWGRTRDDVRAWLEAHGFTVRTRDDDPRPWCRDTLYASRSGAAEQP